MIMAKITKEDIFKDLDYKDLKEGEGVWHKESGDGYIIDKVGKDSAIAVKTIKIVDSSEWVVVKK